jgi:carboxyl-terminal processing protease
MSLSSRRGASAAAGTQSPARTWRTWRRLISVLPVLAALVLAACSGGAGSPALARQVSGQPPPCSANPPPEAPPLHPTTVTTIGQAYYCIFANYYAGPVLDDRVLLAAAFAGFTQELDRLGMDQPDATMPALTGHRDSDWNAFAAVYQKVTSQLPASPAQRQALAAATMTAMVASLDNNHAQWEYPPPLPPGATPGDFYGLGITTSPAYPLAVIAPQEPLPPLFVTAVDPLSPAASHGVRPGDVIVSVNGAPPFADGVVSEGAMNLLFAPYPQAGQVSVRLQRPATGRTWTVTLTPALYTAPPPPTVSAKLLDGDIAYVQLPGFYPGAADVVLQAIPTLATGVKLRGLILDLRGNGGGSPDEVSTLLGVFIHGAAYAYDCDVQGSCAATYTDSSVPLLHLRLVVLTDRNCASACDAFSGAVKDLRLGTLVGTRTSGIVSAPAAPYLLDDASLLGLPAKHELSAHHELINGIGVAPDYYVPLTAHDLSTGHDPDITKALTLLGG